MIPREPKIGILPKPTNILYLFFISSVNEESNNKANYMVKSTEGKGW